jgi:hypothetical protein
MTTMYKINSYVMPIHVSGFTVCSDLLPQKAFKARIARLKRELRINLKESK